MASRSKKSGLNPGRGRGTGEAKVRIGKEQVRMANERPAVAPNFKRLSNKDTLKIAAAGAKNLLEGTIEKNRAKKKKAKK